ncbi:MAG TPA: MFS transporter [Vicinamibacterales bacterium]|nr:MFS transporter [Vicinamibacterales bacterium]
MAARVRPTGVVLFLLCLMYGITYIDRVNVSTAAAVFGRELRLTNTQIGFVFSAFAYPYLLFQILGGWVGDRFGARIALTVAGVIWSVGTLMTGLAGGLATMIGARLVLGFGEGATFPVATRAMSDWTTAGRRGFAQGITHSAARLGNAMTPPMVAALIAFAGWRGSFFVLGAFSLVWTLVWSLYFRDNPAEHPSITRQEIEQLPAYRSRTERQRDPVPWGALIRRMFPVTVVYFCYGWTLWLYLSWIPQYFAQSYKLNLRDSAWFAAGVFFGGVVGDTLGGVATDRVYERTRSRDKARRNLVVCGFLCSLASMLPILFVHDVTIAAICLSAAFFFAEFTIGPMWAIPMDIAPKYAGTASGLMNSGSALAAIISPVIAGYVIDKTGIWELPFIGSIALLLFGSLLAFRMRPGEELEVPARRANGEATA